MKLHLLMLSIIYDKYYINAKHQLLNSVNCTERIYTHTRILKIPKQPTQQLVKLNIILNRERWKKETVKVDNWGYASVQFSSSVVSDSLQPHRLQHTRPPCPSQTPGVYSKLFFHWVGDAIQPSHPLLFPTPPVFNLFQ